MGRVRITRAQRLLLAFQTLTDEFVLVRDERDALREVAKAVALRDYEAAHRAVEATTKFRQISKSLVRREYSIEFKQEVAAAVSKAPHGQRHAICKRLGVAPAQAYQWIAAIKKGKLKGSSALPALEPKLDAATIEKLDRARAAFAFVWQGTPRKRYQSSTIPSVALTETVEVVAQPPRRAQPVVARKNGNPFRRL